MPTSVRSAAGGIGRAVLVGVVLTAVVFGSWAAASPDLSDLDRQGAVRLTDTDGGQSMFSLGGIAPGREGAQARCIGVTYWGRSRAHVGMGARVTGGELPSLVRVRITRGRIPRATRFPSCSGFVADGTDYIGEGNGVLFRGRLTELAGSSPRIPGVRTGRWHPGETHVYRIMLTLAGRAPNDIQGRAARFTFRWTVTA